MNVSTAVVSVAGLAVAGTVLAALPAASEPQPAHVRKVLFAKDATQSLTHIDLGESGFSVGDRVVHVADVYDADDITRKVGFYRGEGVILTTDPAAFQTVFTTHFAEGTVTAMGEGEFAKADTDQAVAVVGGTGAYRLARGTVTARRTTINGESGSLLTYDLVTR